MNQQAIHLLQKIGEDLDQMVFPTVHDGGLVWPAQAAVNLHSPAKENQDVRTSAPQRARPAEAPRASGTPSAGELHSPAAGESDDSGSSRASPSLTFVDHELALALQALAVAYPDVQVVAKDEAVWIRASASILPQLGHRAVFVVVVIPALKFTRGWAFWDYGIGGVQAIGPRHTNYGDASICAFDEKEGIWTYGDSLVTLFDLYSVWAARQLYLREFGHWPGPQASFSPFERLRECNDIEWCGCDNPNGHYVDCCKALDIELTAKKPGNYLAHALLKRCVPAGIIDFALRNEPMRVKYVKWSPYFDVA